MGTARGGISGFSPIVAARAPGDERQANRSSRAAMRGNLAQLRLLPERNRPLPGSAMVVAILLLMLGLFAILSVAFRIGPF